jgi:hypothetical protein
MIKNQRGSITVDYLFAFFLVSGFASVIMTFSVTLSMVEVVQYMTFAASRSYFASNVTEQKQKEAAQLKFLTLKESDVIAPLVNNGWFVVSENDFVADFDIKKYPQFQDYENSQDSGNINLYHGAAAVFRAPILSFQVPFFGGTERKDNSGNDTGFQTTITSFLGREPSFQECNDFNNNRWQQIQQLNPIYGSANSALGAGAYIPINDNGC